MEWSIITDSSCDYPHGNFTFDNVKVFKVPFKINIDSQIYIDTESLDIPMLTHKLKHSSLPSKTACPSPGEWMKLFMASDKVIVITISGSLSGSYNSAIAAKNLVLENHPEKRIFVLDSLSAGPALSLLVFKANDLIKRNYNFDQIQIALLQYVKEIRTIFALSSFDNLVANGRISRFSAVIAGKLDIWGIGIGNDEGKIDIKKKTRGSKKVVGTFIEDMYSQNFKGGHVVISHCLNEELANKIKLKILENWKETEVISVPMRGICSYYAENKGVILAY